MSVATQLMLRVKQNPYHMPEDDSATRYQWCRVSNTEKGELQEGSLGDLSEDIKQHERVPVVFIYSGFDSIFRQVSFSDKERKHLAKTIPFTLEDELLGDIEDLHWVISKPHGNIAYASAVDKAQFSEAIADLAEIGIKPVFSICEQVLLLAIAKQSGSVDSLSSDGPSGVEASGSDDENALPNTAGEQTRALTEQSTWRLYQTQSHLLLDVPEQGFFCIEPVLLESTLSILTQGFTKLPRLIQCHYEQAEQWSQLQAKIPDQLHPLLVKEKCHAFSWLYHNRGLMSDHNLLQGEFAQAKEWKKVWKQWRKVAIVAGVAIVAHLGLMVAQNSQLAAKQEALQVELQQVHRKVLPRGKIVNTRAQFKNELAKLQGSDVGVKFLPLLEKAGVAMNQAQGLKINTMNYDTNNSEIRFDILVKNFQQVETIKTGVQKAGLTYQLQNSNAQGDQLRARIKIKQGS